MSKPKAKRKVTLVPNRPTPEGQALGGELARLTDQAEVEMLKRFPHHRQRCQSCAFRAGTIPNGCPETVMDALKAAVEGVPFYCHQDLDDKGHPTRWCSGWAYTQQQHWRMPQIEVPWAFSIE